MAAEGEALTPAKPRVNWQTATFCILKEGETVGYEGLKPRQLAYIARAMPGTKAEEQNLRDHWSDALRKANKLTKTCDSAGYVKRVDTGFFLNPLHAAVRNGSAAAKYAEWNAGQAGGTSATPRLTLRAFPCWLMFVSAGALLSLGSVTQCRRHSARVLCLGPRSCPRRDPRTHSRT
jgi:hypothetical protein